MRCSIAKLLLGLCLQATALPQSGPGTEGLEYCGNGQYYYPSSYTCISGSFLCPIIDGVPTKQCGDACYLESMYSCQDGNLASTPSSGTTSGTNSSSAAGCTATPQTQHLSSPPYENYFYSDCHSATQVVVTSPLPDSNLTIIGPRLLVAWPAGDSGLVAFFAPQNGINGSLGLELIGNQPLSPIYSTKNTSSDSPIVGIKTLVRFNSSATLTIPILGSIRTMRDFIEGPSILAPQIQDGNKFSSFGQDGAMISRLWLDNKTVTQMSFSPQSNGASASVKNKQIKLEAGTYEFSASFDYPQLTQLSASEVLNLQSRGLITTETGKTTSLSFLSYTEKLLAGAWRFLTYFGRDSMITLLLMQPVLSEGQGGAIEAVIGAVLERINKTDGYVCHEETIGDYATYQHLLLSQSSNQPICSYIMIDSNYYLAPVMDNYFVKSAVGRSRKDAFFSQKATLNFGNRGLLFSNLALRNAEEVMRSAARFAAPGGQTKANLVHLEQDQIVGEWRDSTYGIGGGRIPYDVNTALVPAALRAIASLSGAGFFPEHPDWSTTAAKYAKVWEDSTLQFFQEVVPMAQAKSLVQSYASSAGYGFPSHASNITNDVIYHGLSLNGNDDQPVIKVMNTDDCFRHYLLNTTNEDQLTAFINQTANNIRAPFPVGLSNPLGLLVANPAYGGAPVYAANWTNNAYHGTVIWSWPMAMMAAGLQRQIGRCSESSPPAFCSDSTVRENAVAAYTHLWDLIEANSAHTSSEVWSWQYKNGGFQYIDFGALPPPPGTSPTESDIRQLWSLTFLAVTRDKSIA